MYNAISTIGRLFGGSSSYSKTFSSSLGPARAVLTLSTRGKGDDSAMQKLGFLHLPILVQYLCMYYTYLYRQEYHMGIQSSNSICWVAQQKFHADSIILILQSQGLNFYRWAKGKRQKPPPPREKDSKQRKSNHPVGIHIRSLVLRIPVSISSPPSLGPIYMYLYGSRDILSRIRY